MRIASASLFEYCLPLTAPLRLGAHRLESRSGLLIQLTCNLGNAAWGEAAPLPGFSPETLDEVRTCLLDVCANLRGHEITPEADLAAPFRLRIPSAGSALDMALLRLHAAREQKTLGEFLSIAASPGVPLARLITGDSFESALLLHTGSAAVKLKAGGRPWQNDVQRVRRVAQTLGHNTRIRLDANRAWSLDDARQFVAHLADISIEFLEEPLADPRELPAFAAATRCPIALDETFREMLQASEDSNILGAASFLVWKPTLTPISPSEMAAFARAHGVPIVLSGAYESGLATSAYASYASAFSPLGLAAGLDTYSRLREDVLESRLPLNVDAWSTAYLEDAVRTVNMARLTLLWNG